MELKRIGTIKCEEGFEIRLESDYKEALKGLKGFSHLMVIWWADHFDEETYRCLLTTEKPYKTGPDVIGLFATRSPVRPNPVCVTIVDVKDIDFEKGLIKTHYIDAENNTPLLDIKPYYPCSDRVTSFKAPEWCDFLPQDVESSADFDWTNFFNF